MLTQAPFLPRVETRDPSVEMRSRIDTLTREMASGQTEDQGRAISSDFSALSRLVHDMGTASSKKTSLLRAESWTGTMQIALETVSDRISDLSGQMGSALSASGDVATTALSETGEGALRDVLSALGRTQGGRAIFANGDPEGNPLPAADDLISDLRLVASSAADVEALSQSFDDYFGPGGDFETNHMRNFPTEPATFPLGQGRSIDIPVDLNSPAIRGALRDAALVAVLPSAGFDLDLAAKQDLTSRLVRDTSETTSGLVSERARLGGVETRIADYVISAEEERTSLEMKIADILAADPYDTAVRLQEEMTRLESLYAITARRSRLTLTDYLR